jgi:ATP-dependent RNA helicase HelY
MGKKENFISTARKRLLQGIGVPEPAPFVIDEFQAQAIEHVTKGDDVLVVAPTGAGKTFIAFEAIRATIATGARAVYTTPLKALSNTKFNELSDVFRGTADVGLLTGDRKIESNARVVVATTEIYRNELYRSSSDGYGLIVLDEVHFIADPQRGPVWEESIILTPHDSTLLMLSASISNAEEIAEWIGEVRGKRCVVVTRVNRPVELRLAFLHPQFGVVPLEDSSGNLFDEVGRCYEGIGLDPTGMRLKKSRKGGPQAMERGSERRTHRKGKRGDR